MAFVALSAMEWILYTLYALSIFGHHIYKMLKFRDGAISTASAIAFLVLRLTFVPLWLSIVPQMSPEPIQPLGVTIFGIAFPVAVQFIIRCPVFIHVLASVKKYIRVYRSDGPVIEREAGLADLVPRIIVIYKIEKEASDDILASIIAIAESRYPKKKIHIILPFRSTTNPRCSKTSSMLSTRPRR